MSAPYDAPVEPVKRMGGGPERMKHLARLLRGVGAVVLLSAASTFLLQQWHDAGDVSRYLGLLGLSALLAGAGFWVGIGIRESRSARTFLTLAAATVPAHFAIVGGLLYSQWVPSGSPLPAMGYALWHAPSAGVALAVAALSLAILIPIVFLAFTALARARAREATALLFAMGLLSWVPLRDPYWSTALVAALCAALVAFEMRFLRHAPGLRTHEGALLRLVLAAPPALIALRGLLHYEFTWFLVSVLGVVAALLAAAGAVEARVPKAWRLVFEGFAIAAGALTCGSFALGVHQIWPLHPSARLLSFGVPFAAGLAGLAILVAERRGTYANAAAWCALGTVGFNLLFFGDSVSALLALAVGIATLADGFLREKRPILVAGGLCAVIALLVQVWRAAAQYTWSTWGALAVVGAVVIVAAALIERHHAALQERAVALRSRVATWEY